jgi:hypothetical protein
MLNISRGVFTADCEERGKKYAQALKDKAAATEQIISID